MTRKFRTILIWSIIVLNVLIGVTAVAMRDNLFRFLITPAVPFQVDEHPPAPDYNSQNGVVGWVTKPTGDYALESKGPDIFIVHPTTAWSGTAGWNADVGDPEASKRLSEVVFPNHIEPFQGDKWVPKYRQAVLYASLARREDSREALDLAYSDVERAYTYFDRAHNSFKPQIIVGIGQGGLHVLRLLQSQKARRGNLAVAYIIDQPVPTALYEGPTAVSGFPKPCTNRTSRNCFISYTAIDGGDSRGAEQVSQRSIIWTPIDGYHSLNGQPFACVNPLTGGTDTPNALASLNRGSAAATGLERGTKPPLLPGETGARCRNGLLLVEVNRPAAISRQRLDLGTFYKVTGYNLFYDALAKDSALRAQR